jgi:hypothetical protein
VLCGGCFKAAERDARANGNLQHLHTFLLHWCEVRLFFEPSLTVIEIEFNSQIVGGVKSLVNIRAQ